LTLPILPDRGARIGPFFGSLYYNSATALFVTCYCSNAKFRAGVDQALEKIKFNILAFSL